MALLGIHQLAVIKEADTKSSLKYAICRRPATRLTLTYRSRVSFDQRAHQMLSQMMELQSDKGSRPEMLKRRGTYHLAFEPCKCCCIPELCEHPAQGPKQDVQTRLGLKPQSCDIPMLMIGHQRKSHNRPTLSNGKSHRRPALLSC